MTHPLITEITELATPIAEQLNLEIANIVFQTNKNPSLLRVDIRNRVGDTSLDDCEKMSRLLEEILEGKDIIAEAYSLEISSPGIADVLTTDREFISFQGFPVMVKTHTPHKKKTQFEGTLRSRDEDFVYLNCKGRIVKIPRELVEQVSLRSASE
ncbi:ribosome maturation factor RimP [Cyanobacterium stanieri LEGE 03274]|uniref:Ribosome maturation factor RimP n=1 Tax=Cyanobacterium stanieri LEGE 03274 TaxID=1828756 RepID=A0ABR9V2V1_9CHRO|nr:ribosome maturation factor RimP [Cyanobacterium stanieri]MBE9222220.1 ribosome maturation factor RimP [Cyanobacterium stanieri LEGE 03274]